jgi:hypothetical protein
MMSDSKNCILNEKNIKQMLNKMKWWKSLFYNLEEKKNIRIFFFLAR